MAKPAGSYDFRCKHYDILPLENDGDPIMGSKRTSGSFETEVDTVDREQWSAVVQRFADANIYQTWQYGAVRWGPEKLSHCLFKLDGRVVACVQVAIFRAPVVSAGVAYLRWGPLHRSVREGRASTSCRRCWRR
jgi:hypothetical protein